MREDYLSMMAARDTVMLCIGMVVIVWLAIIEVENERVKKIASWLIVALYFASWAAIGFAVLFVA